MRGTASVSAGPVFVVIVVVSALIHELEGLKGLSWQASLKEPKSEV